MYTWDQLCEDPRFQNLPYRVELLKDGTIIMSPHKRYHSTWQYNIQLLLKDLLPQGKALPEAPVLTSDGIRSADVGWVSDMRNAIPFSSGVFEIAPEICIEVLSASNRRGEIDDKRRLFFEAGAEEFWVCHKNGKMDFYLPEGKAERSRFCPDFPLHLPKE